MNCAFHNYSSAKKNTTNESNMDIVLYIAECGKHFPWCFFKVSCLQIQKQPSKIFY